jgi:hypothetical protein
MNRIPKCRSKYYIPQPNNINPSQKESNKENLAQKINKKTLKFNASRHFGKDITNNIKSNVHNIYNSQNTKIVTIIEKKQQNNNTIYIKKHSSSSQVAHKNQKIKINVGDKKLRENKSGYVINKSTNTNTYNSNINNIETKKDNIKPIISGGRTKLHSSISFGANANNVSRPISSSNNNTNNNNSISVSVRLSNPKNINNNNNKTHTSLNNRSISIHNSTSNLIYGNYNYLNSNNTSLVNNKNHSNNIYNNNNNTKNEMAHTHSNIDLM